MSIKIILGTNILIELVILPEKGQTLRKCGILFNFSSDNKILVNNQNKNQTLNKKLSNLYEIDTLDTNGRVEV